MWPTSTNKGYFALVFELMHYVAFHWNSLIFTKAYPWLASGLVVGSLAKEKAEVDRRKGQNLEIAFTYIKAL